MSINRVVECIQNNQVFLITAHLNLEGDALGSEIALYYLLKKLGKTPVIVNQDAVPEEYGFLREVRLIRRFRRNMKINFDVLLMVDCSNKSRCGCVSELAVSGQPIVNIDHHISNDRFGDINWVMPNASSASEMIYHLYKAMRLELDKDIARVIYIGILTDTGSFRYQNTTSVTHQVVSRLLKYKINVFEIYRKIYASVHFSDIVLLTKILTTLKKDATGKIVFFEIKKRLLKGKKVQFDLTDGALKLGRLVKDSEVCVLFKEQKDSQNEIRVNLRSQGKVDVNRVASFFGGGGHKTASGCTIKGRLDAVKRKVLLQIKKQL